MAADVNVVRDGADDLNLADLAPDRFAPHHCALRVEPTPGTGDTQLAEDVLMALRRRPKLAFRWSDSAIGAREAAWLWCDAHGIRHIVIPRAHTIAVKNLTELIVVTGSFARHDAPITWWLIDASGDGSLARQSKALGDYGACELDASEMRRDIRDTQEQRDGDGVRSAIVPTPTSVHNAILDAHPALFGRGLRRTLPAQDREAFSARFAAARQIVRSADRFGRWELAVWYCLRAARDAADSLVVFRAAQLALLERRKHLAMRTGAWAAAEDARRCVADDAEKLLAYVDPLVASIGALSLQTGFSANTLASMTVGEVHGGAVPSIAGFDAGHMDSWIAPLVAAQCHAANQISGSAGRRPLFVRTRERHGGTAVVTVDRINAVLQTIEMERDIQFDHRDWIDGYGVTAEAV